MTPDPKVLTRFAVRDAERIVETGIATIWKVVRLHDGEPAALKIYHGATMKNEEPGLLFLKDQPADVAPRVYDQTSAAVLMEWLNGQNVGDGARAGDDATATRHMADMAQALHRHAAPLRTEYRPLNEVFQALLTRDIADQCPPDLRAAYLKCQSIAADLLDTQTDIRPLHGDLHHDNVLLSPRGPRAIDAKGVLGERAYELANALRNPKGARDTLRDPVTLKARLHLWSMALDTPQKRLLGWGCAKAALSIAWDTDEALGVHPDGDLLSLFLSVWDQL